MHFLAHVLYVKQEIQTRIRKGVHSMGVGWGERTSKQIVVMHRESLHDRFIEMQDGAERRVTLHGHWGGKSQIKS